jgi:hypothetical protein
LSPISILKWQRWQQLSLPPPIYYRLAPVWLNFATARMVLAFSLARKLPGEQTMTLTITHSKWDSPDHFEALGFDDVYPNMVIRFDYAPQTGWYKWRHGGWLPIMLHEVPADVMVRYGASKPL